MTDKDFKHLSKTELIEIIYQQKKDEVALRAELQSVKDKLKSKEMKFEKVGSIAEAAIAVNGVFESAQKAADEYLTQLYIKYADIETYCSEQLAQTEEKCRKREEETEKKIDAAWVLYRKKAQEYIRAHNELFKSADIK